jgi:hypothetical protein
VTPAAKPPLRIGLLVDSLVQPRWVHTIVEAISRSSIATIVLVVKNTTEPGRGGASLLRQAFTKRRHLLRRLYIALDELIFRAQPNPFESVDLRPLLGDCPVLEVTPRRTKYSDYLQPADVATVLGYRLDVAFRFGFRILRGDVLDIATHGVWSYHHGDNRVMRGGPAGFWEVMQGDDVTGSILQILTPELDAGRVLYRSWASTYKFSVWRNRANYYWKSAAFAMRKLRELYEGGVAVLDDEPQPPLYRPYSNRLYRGPGNLEMLGLLARLGSRIVRRGVLDAFHFGQWFVAYKIGAEDAPTTSFHDLKMLMPPKDRFWADPCAVEKDGTYFIFMEEFLYETNKGHVSVIEIGPSGTVKPPVKVLERDYHLSYPFLFEWRGTHYMIPETGANKTVELYRAVEFPYRWELEKVLLEDIRAVDATVEEVEGTWWMFTNLSFAGSSASDELYLFHADSPLGPWRPHPRNPVKSDVRSSRPAGRLFRRDGRLYRPAQDASVFYGYAIVINRIIRLTPTEFAEEEVSRILPRWRGDLERNHTLNSAGRLTVIDGYMRRSRWL